MPARPNLPAIAALPSKPFSDTVYRIVAEAMRDSILSTEGNRYYPGRYHIVGETGTLYTSLQRGTASREIGRHAFRADLRGKVAVGRIRIRLPRVLDLTDEANLRDLRVSREDLISSDHSITQAIALHARKAGVQGLLVPSATGRGENLVVFENNLGEGCLIEVEDVSLWNDDHLE